MAINGIQSYQKIEFFWKFMISWRHISYSAYFVWLIFGEVVPYYFIFEFIYAKNSPEHPKCGKNSPKHRFFAKSLNFAKYIAKRKLP